METLTQEMVTSYTTNLSYPCLSKDLWFDKEFRPTFNILYIFKECSCGVRTTNFTEMKGRRLTLAKRGYIETPNYYGALESLIRRSFLYSHLLANLICKKRISRSSPENLGRPASGWQLPPSDPC